jgi:tetratricopeptide (TPR) repeat protein
MIRSPIATHFGDSLKPRLNVSPNACPPFDSRRPSEPAPSVLRLPPNEMLQRAIQALNNGQLVFAEEACRSVLKMQPQRGDAWLVLAKIVMDASRLEEAEDLLRKAETFGASVVEVTRSRSSLRWRQGRDQESLDLCRKVLSLQPGDPESLVRMAACERRMGDPSQCLRRCATLKDNPSAAVIAAWAHLDLKDPAAALAVLAPYRSHPAVIGTQRSNFFHVLGQAHEALGRYDEALESYGQSKAAIPLKYDEAALRKSFTEVRDFFSRDFLQRASRASTRSERPVFIAAMPRSGTTLLDRIIAAHPQAAGAGETRALRGQIAEWNQPPAGPGQPPRSAWPGIVGTFGVAELDRIAGRYLRETDMYGPQAARIADKHLMNWTFVGLIEMAFPASRIIHIRRDPLDAGISCFERLRPNAVYWSGSLRTIGIALRAADLLLEHWKSVCTVPILTVEYESLVRHQEAETRRIVEFLGLPWDDACLAFHAKGGSKPAANADGERRIEPAPTLASEQASKPMYDSSIGRGARFGAGLDPLREAYDEPL